MCVKIFNLFIILTFLAEVEIPFPTLNLFNILKIVHVTTTYSKDLLHCKYKSQEKWKQQLK